MTMQVEQTYGAPPQYPTANMVPKEFWRKSEDADPTYTQTITIETPGGPVKKTVVRGWTKPVTFASDAGDV